jgi:hypothetical protein
LLYGGPTLCRANAIREPNVMDLVVLPPIERGDVDRLIQSGDEPGVLVVVDGFFHLNTLAVGHRELRTAIERGWIVWGLSSMGAIRACEMKHLGMRGYGTVFDMYCADPDFRDDEVALLHEPDPPYREASEPLVHMRMALADLERSGVLSKPQAEAVLGELLPLWFGERDLPLFASLILKQVPDRRTEVQAMIAGFDRYRVKALDLLSYLDNRIYLT